LTGVTSIGQIDGTTLVQAANANALNA